MFTFGSWVSDLLKARGHRYIKRIPYMSGGKRRYRYIYKVTHTHRGRQAFDAEHLDIGTAFALHTEAGAEFHGHITAVQGDQITYRIDDGERKGESVTVSKSELLSQLNDVHGIESKLNAEREKLRSQIKIAKEKGSEKQVKRLEERLARLGGGEEKQGGTLTGKYAEIFEKHAVTPDLVELSRWYSKRPYWAHPWGHELNNTQLSSDHQDSAMYQRLEDLAPRRAEACARYNQGLKRALTEIQKAMGERESKLDALNREIEALHVSNEELNREAGLVNEMRREAEDIVAGLATKHDLFWGHIAYQDLEREDPEGAKRLRALFGRHASRLDEGTTFPRDLLTDLRREGVLEYKGQRISYVAKTQQRVRLKAQRDEIASNTDFLSGLIFDGSGDTGGAMEIIETGVKSARGGQAPKIVAQFAREMRALYPDYSAKLTSVYIDYQRASKRFRANCLTLPEQNKATLKVTKDSDRATILHEIAHTLEYFAPEVQDAVTLSHATRVKAGNTSRVKNGRRTEEAFDDRYHSHYAGKLYNSSVATELVTMGVQEFASVRRALKLHDKDLHHFAVTYAILKGYFSDEN